MVPHCLLGDTSVLFHYRLRTRGKRTCKCSASTRSTPAIFLAFPFSAQRRTRVCRCLSCCHPTGIPFAGPRLSGCHPAGICFCTGPRPCLSFCHSERSEEPAGRQSNHKSVILSGTIALLQSRRRRTPKLPASPQPLTPSNHRYPRQLSLRATTKVARFS